MRRLLLAMMVVLALLAAGASARPVETHEAECAALSALPTSSSSHVGPAAMASEIVAVHELRDEDDVQVLGYVYDLHPRGFVVVAADTEMVPVIASSFETSFSWDESAENLLLHLLRADLALRSAALADGQVSLVDRRRHEDQWDALGRSSAVEPRSQSRMIGPLLEAPTWAQGAPWNDYAPIDPRTGERSLAGCVAVSLAQIVNYWQYPSSVRFSSADSYVTRMRGISVDATSASIDSIEYPEVSFYSPDDRVMAELARAAGVSVRMDYSAQGSGAYATDIAVALAGSAAPVSSSAPSGVWGYASAEIRSYVNRHWGAPYVQSIGDFYDELRDDLEEGVPAILCVTISGTTIGHTVIADGFDPESGRYHLNLGWGGYSDGWYALPEDMPPGYNVVEYGILNIQPPASGSGPGNPSDSPASPGSDEARTMAFSTTPNPFARKAVFEYLGGETPDLVSVSIYGLDGRVLWMDEVQYSDEISWDGTGQDGERLANGAYIYVMVVSVDGETLARRGTVILQR